jgi:predicted nucleotidyltransferase
MPSERTPISKGQDDEIKEAHESGKHIFLISPRAKLSPFFKYAHRIFKTKEEFMPFWKEHLKWALQFYKR